MKPEVACLMLSSVDGRLNPSQWSHSPDGNSDRWTEVYEELHKRLAGDAWMVGRVTMAEMSKATAHPSGKSGPASRAVYRADPEARSFAVALDPAGKLHFSKSTVSGDHVIVLLSATVGDEHLHELMSDGVSYVVATGPHVDLAVALDILKREFGIDRLLLEGGGGVNGSLIAAGLVDELHVLMAPALEGRTSSRSIVETGDDSLLGKIEMSLASCEQIDGGVVYLRYKIRNLSDRA
jgi:riboflavin biosynthesis pyrimidine reductase